MTAPDLVVGVFGHWRAAVSHAVHAAISVPARTGAAVWLTSVARFLSHPADIAASDDPHPGLLVSRTGYACLTIGAALAAIVTFRGGAGAFAAATDAAWLIVWAAARYAVMRLASGDVMRKRPSAVMVAWAGGLFPLIFAATPALHAAALVVSAALTWRALCAEGAPTREASLMVGWGFGGQAAVEVVAWVVRGGIIYALLLGR